MDVREILENIDRLLHQCRLDEAEAYMKSCLEQAHSEGRTDIEITVYNELAGFYRDCGNFDNSLLCCRRSEELLDIIKEGDTPRRCAALLNSANACRASGLLDEAYGYYEKIWDILQGLSDEDDLLSSYYNNLALLHQEAGRWEDARDCLENALHIAERSPEGEIRTAISRSNLAVCLIRLGCLDEAKNILAPAMDIFKGRSPSDFHYSAALAAMGDILFNEGKYPEAAEYYEAALSEIELHMGRNNFFDTVSGNLAAAYDKSGGRPVIKGAELCRRYFEAFGRPMLKRNFGDILQKLACGLAGEGSECLGFDDEISADHDFGPSFVIWVDDDTFERFGSELQAAYDLLPKTFMGMKRLITPHGDGRTGVMRISDFLAKFTGCGHVPVSYEEWLCTDDALLACAVNGEVYMDYSGEFEDIRRRLRVGQPQAVRLKKLAQQLALAGQSGQYNYNRAVMRGDSGAAFVALSDFMQSSARAAHILCGRYAPYSKWLFKSAALLPRLGNISDIIRDISEGKDVRRGIDMICRILGDEVRSQLIADSTEEYLAQLAEEVSAFADRVIIAEEIILMEWNWFDKVQNEGGRADCQDDWETFSIMRRSQYYCWNEELLRSLLLDFRAAAEDGRNPIREKYGYMMQSTAPARFEEIKSSLPDISEEKAALREAIIPIQVGWMEEFAEKYPRLAAGARVIHTYEDSPAQTSYETYLRGELSTYSDVTLKLYGGFIVSVSNAEKNLAGMIMERSVKMYGFGSLAEAEEKQ
ncbi:MAG: DUF4125 family protein [Oscillospiraceae bacterium]|nr:DUF4125 family protein [Oscillospiraceae bacterium]